MSIGSAAILSIKGGWDVFDRAAALLEDQKRRLHLLDGEDIDSLGDISMLGGELSETGGYEELLSDVDWCIEQLAYVRLRCQKIEQAIPD